MGDVYKGAVASVIDWKLGQDVVSGFLAGATGTALNCWTDVCRSVIQKKALADTFNPEIPRPGMLAPYNPGPFFAEAGSIFASRGIGAILAVLMPRFKTMYFEARGLY